MSLPRFLLTCPDSLGCQHYAPAHWCPSTWGACGGRSMQHQLSSSKSCCMSLVIGPKLRPYHASLRRHARARSFSPSQGTRGVPSCCTRAGLGGCCCWQLPPRRYGADMGSSANHLCSISCGPGWMCDAARAPMGAHCQEALLATVLQGRQSVKRPRRRLRKASTSVQICLLSSLERGMPFFSIPAWERCRSLSAWPARGDLPPTSECQRRAEAIGPSQSMTRPVA